MDAPGEDPRGPLVREAFAAVTEEFLRMVKPDMSGSVTIHFHSGIPGSVSWELKGRPIRRPVPPES